MSAPVPSPTDHRCPRRRSSSSRYSGLPRSAASHWSTRRGWCRGPIFLTPGLRWVFSACGTWRRSSPLSVIGHFRLSGRGRNGQAGSEGPAIAARSRNAGSTLVGHDPLERRTRGLKEPRTRASSRDSQGSVRCMSPPRRSVLPVPRSEGDCPRRPSQAVQQDDAVGPAAKSIEQRVRYPLARMSPP